MEKKYRGVIYTVITITVLVAVVYGITLTYPLEKTNITSANVTPGQNWTNVSYANLSQAQEMDIYLPDTAGPYPVIIWIHGGGYMSGDKNNGYLHLAKEGLKRGYAVVSINYRLTNEAQHPAQINDVKAAIRFLRANSNEYNLNPDKIAVWGSSAGGGLAALAGTSGNVEELQDDSLGNSNTSDQVQAVVDMKGPINFSTLLPQLQNINNSNNNSYNYNETEHMLEKLMGGNVSLIPDQVAMANPETFISTDDPPFFIVHGNADSLIPFEQSVDFANKLQKVLGSSKVTIEVIPGADHNATYFSTQQNINQILDFLDKNLK